MLDIKTFGGSMGFAPRYSLWRFGCVPKYIVSGIFLARGAHTVAKRHFYVMYFKDFIIDTFVTCMIRRPREPTKAEAAKATLPSSFGSRIAFICDCVVRL